MADIDQPGIELAVRQHARELSPKMRGALLTARAENGWIFVASSKRTTAALIGRGLATPYAPDGSVSVVGVLTELGRTVRTVRAVLTENTGEVSHG